MKDTTKHLSIQPKKSESKVEKLSSKGSFERTKRIKIKESPFTIIKKDEKSNWQIVIGNEVASKYEFKYAYQAKRYIKRKTWMLQLTALMIIMSHREKIVKDE